MAGMPRISSWTNQPGFVISSLTHFELKRHSILQINQKFGTNIKPAGKTTPKWISDLPSGVPFDLPPVLKSRHEN